MIHEHRNFSRKAKIFTVQLHNKVRIMWTVITVGKFFFWMVGDLNHQSHQTCVMLALTRLYFGTTSTTHAGKYIWNNFERASVPLVRRDWRPWGIQSLFIVHAARSSTEGFSPPEQIELPLKQVKYWIKWFHLKNEQVFDTSHSPLNANPCSRVHKPFTWLIVWFTTLL